MDLGPAFSLSLALDDPSVLFADVDAPSDPEFDRWLVEEFAADQEPEQQADAAASDSSAHDLLLAWQSLDASTLQQHFLQQQAPAPQPQQQQLLLQAPPLPPTWLSPQQAQPMQQQLQAPPAWPIQQQQQQPAAAAVGGMVFGSGLQLPSLAQATVAAGAAAPQPGMTSPRSLGGGGRKGRGVAGTTAGAVAAAGEKPKAPSRRFRERQRETISSLEAELSGKLAQLQVLSAENEMLKLRSAVLEATVRGREYHMKIIEEHGAPIFQSTSSSDDSTNLAAVLRSGSGTTASSCCQQTAAPCSGSEQQAPVAALVACSDSGTAVAVAPAASHASCDTGERMAAAGGAGSSPTSAAAAHATASFEPQLPCGGSAQACPPAEQQRAIRNLKRMSAPELTAHWKRFLQEVTAALLHAEDEEEQQQQQPQQQQPGQAVGSPDSGTYGSAAASLSKTCRWCSCEGGNCSPSCAAPGRGAGAGRQPLQPVPPQAAAPSACSEGPGQAAARSCTPIERRIASLVSTYGYMTKWIALLNPGVMYSMFGRDLDTGLPAPYSDEHWRQVVSVLRLSKDQVTQILACAELYFGSLTRLLDERRRLQQQLRNADEGLAECQRRLLGVDGTMTQLQVLDALARNLRREHVLRIMLNCFVWGRTLNSVQFARCAVYSHPFLPDIHAMVSVLFADARAVAPDGQAAMVFPHRSYVLAASQAAPVAGAPAAAAAQEVALHERLRAESEELRAQSLSSGGSAAGLAAQQVMAHALTGVGA